MSNLLRLVACLFLFVSLNSFGAYYVKNDGSIVDPIEFKGCHPYCNYNGPNLEPGVTVRDFTFIGVVLNDANLAFSDFSGSIFDLSYLWDVNFSHANLEDTNLLGGYYGANFFNANLRGSYHVHPSPANFKNSDLTNATFFYPANDSNFEGAIMTGISYGLWSEEPKPNFEGSTYNQSTIFPTGFDPTAEGMIFVSEVPLPAGIYLFLSGLVGLGLMRGRNA